MRAGLAAVVDGDGAVDVDVDPGRVVDVDGPATVVGGTEVAGEDRAVVGDEVDTAVGDDVVGGEVVVDLAAGGAAEVDPLPSSSS